MEVWKNIFKHPIIDCWLAAIEICQLLLEKCPNMEFFLVRISPHSGWIWRDTQHTPYLSIFSPNARNNGPEKTPYLDTFHAMQSFLFIVQNNWLLIVISDCNILWHSSSVLLWTSGLLNNIGILVGALEITDLRSWSPIHVFHRWNSSLSCRI